MADARSAPTATGTLAATPLVHVLVYARNKRLTGLVELATPDGRRGTMELWRGHIAAATTAPPVAFLGTIVYELGWIDGATLDATLLVLANEKRLHGEILVERGAITKEQRDAALLEQACRKVHHFFSFPDETTFAFYDARPGASEPPVLLDPLAPAWRGLRERPPEKSVREVLAKYPATALRVVNEAPIGRLGLTSEETAVVDELVARPMTVAQLRALGKAPSPRVDLLLYLFLVGKCVEPVSASQPAMPAARASSPSMPAVPRAPPSSTSSLPPTSASSSSTGSERRIPPAPTSSAQAMRALATPGFPSSGEVRTRPPSFRVPSAPRVRVATPSPSSTRIAPADAITSPLAPSDLGPTGIAARALGLEKEGPFDALNLPSGASIEAVRAAYYRLARMWHPDRLPADLAPLRAEVAAIFAHMTDAHRMLTDPHARRAWEAANAGDDAAKTPKRSRANVMRDIDSALAKRDFALAAAESQRMYQLDPDDAEALAIAAWSSAAAGEAGEDALRAAIALLDHAVASDRECDRAYYYRGVLQKRIGSTAAAVRDFARAHAINPKNIDAEREVRLAEMRARKGSGEHALGLLGKTKK